MNIAIVIFILIVSAGLLVFVMNPSNNNVTNTSSKNQSMIGNWMDIHGIGIFPKEKDNGNSLFIATHNGLYKKEQGNLSSWRLVGYHNLDLKGYAIDPIKGVMYTSGHPFTTGNLGFRISSDYGISWQKVSDVTAPTPIDFHTITMGNVPKIIYASTEVGYAIYISLDEGKTWQPISSPDEAKIITLAANKTDSDILYVSTTNGLFSSIDRGKNWQKIIDELIDGDSHDTIVTGLEISPDGKTVYAFVTPGRGDDVQGYVVKSHDGAKTWTKTVGQIDEAVYISKFGFGNDDEIYAIVDQNSARYGMASSVYKSTDQGNKWLLQGTNNNLLAGV